MELIKQSPTANVFVKLDILLILVEFAHLHAEIVSLYSKEHVQLAH